MSLKSVLKITGCPTCHREVASYSTLVLFGLFIAGVFLEFILFLTRLK